MRCRAHGGRTLTWQFIDGRRRSDGYSLVCSVGTDAPSVQQSLQRFGLTGLVLTAQSRAASAGVHAARLTEAEGARHAAAAARFSDSLGAVLGQRFAQKARRSVTWLASDDSFDRT